MEILIIEVWKTDPTTKRKPVPKCLITKSGPLYKTCMHMLINLGHDPWDIVEYLYGEIYEKGI
jgi:hypothetical protein